MAGWHNVEVFTILVSCRSNHYVPTPSWWWNFKGHHMLSMATPLVLAYYSNYVPREHADARLIWRIAVLELLVWTFKGFLCSLCNGPVEPESGFCPPSSCKSCILVWLPVAFQEALEIMRVMAVLCVICFRIPLVHMAYCWSQNVEWSRC